MTVPEDILAGLDDEQREVASHLHGPLVVLAGAGTGKTRAMTHRIAYGVATGVMKPTEVLALTFTAKAAGEMRARLRALGAGNVQARTIHAAALRQLTFFWPELFTGPVPTVLSHKAPLVATALAERGLPADRDAVRDMAAEIEWAAVGMLTPEDYVTHERRLPDGVEPDDVVAAWRAYDRLKSEKYVIDFEDVLLLVTGILQARPDIAAQVHAQYRHFVVDEYQDVSLLQHTLLDLWLGHRSSMCVVGDASQTIYSFAGASPEFLLGFSSRFPDAAVVRLVRDYRSTPQIVDVANRVLAHGPQRGRLELVSGRDSGPLPRFREFEDDAAEAQAVAEDIATEVAQGRRPQDIAILFRTNGQSQNFEAALAERGISYVLRGAERFFARKEVRESLALLRGAAKAETSARPLPALVSEVLTSLGWNARPPQGTGAVRERWESLQAIVDVAEELQARSSLPVPLTALVADLEDRAEHQNAPALSGVTLASLHASKGLEWESVYLVGLSDGLLPIAYAETPEAVEEERRLLYVGITRAGVRLNLSWSASRGGGSRNRRSASRFIAELGERATRPSRQEARSRAREEPATRLAVSCRVCGAALTRRVERQLGRCASCPSDADPRVVRALEEWRAREAASEGIPEFMVLSQTTLVAVAEALPGSAEELGAVPGIGDVKTQRYGAALLGVLASGTSRSVG